MDLFEETLAEVEGKDGERYLVRRNPARAKELAASRPDKLATLRTAGQATDKYSSEHPRAAAKTQVSRLNQRAKTLHIDKFVRGERSVALTVDQDALTELARLDGCYALRADLSKAAIERDRARPLQRPDPGRMGVPRQQVRASGNAAGLSARRKPHE
jgi:hypothetical protein